MPAPTKILVWSPDEVAERTTKALEIMDELTVDELHWEAVFNGVIGMLSAAVLQQEQTIPLAASRIFQDRK